jgi:16S rRNA U516 pseudouridylate synthase RsuA-like enzyme
VARVEILGTDGNLSCLRITLREGKNRHIRRLFNALRDNRLGKPLKVMALKRIRFGSTTLDLAEGKWRFLDPGETERLLAGDGRAMGTGPDPGPARPI